MALMQPKRTKHRKTFRGKREGVATRGNALTFGSFGLKAIEAGWITARQLESARRAMAHYTQRGGRIWIRVFPDKPITKHPAESRMGSGKGDVCGYVVVVKPGQIIFEMGAVSEIVAQEALRLAGHKLPIDVKFTSRDERMK